MGKIKYSRDKSVHAARSILLEESGSPIILRLTILFGCAILLGFIFWANEMEIEEVSVAQGEIVPSGNVQTVQNLEGGIIREILVKEGQLVEKDQLIMRLDPFEFQAKMDQGVVELERLLAKKTRLTAIINWTQPDFSRLEMISRDSAREQMEAYRKAMESLSANKAVLKNQIKQFQAQLEELDSKNEKLSREKDLLVEEMNMREELIKQKLFSELQFLTLKHKVSANQGELEQTQAQKQNILEKIEETKNNIKEIDASFIEKASEELGKINDEISRLQEKKKADEQKIDMMDVKAPVSGTIHGLKAHTIGGVISPGSTIMQVVPSNNELIAEVQILSKDIGHVHAGQEALVKFTTFDFARYGGIDGELKEISPTSFLDKNGNPYYRGTVVLKNNYIRIGTKNSHILSGMVITADIKTGKKTVMEYLLKPIFTSVRQALRER